MLCSSTLVFSPNYSFDPWDDYARGFIGLKHVTIIDGQLSVTNFDFTWSWKIYSSESGCFSLTKNKHLCHIVKYLFITKLSVNSILLIIIWLKFTKSFTNFYQLFRNANFKPNTILATLSE